MNSCRHKWNRRVASSNISEEKLLTLWYEVKVLFLRAASNIRCLPVHEVFGITLKSIDCRTQFHSVHLQIIERKQ